MSTVIEYPKLSDGFILDEDNALRRHLMGLKVSDDASHPRKVGVWFAHPDKEIREQRYPYILLSLIDISEASNRVQAGFTQMSGVDLDWVAELMPGVILAPDENGITRAYNGDGLWSDVWRDSPSVPLRFFGPAPIPVQIDYQVRAFSRHPRHSRSILAGLLGRKVPYRYGNLDMRDIDGSIRRIELLDIAHGESVEDGKRLFVSVFTIRVDSFMPNGDENNLFIYEDEVVVKVVTNLSKLVDDGQGIGIMTPEIDPSLGSWVLNAESGGRWDDKWNPIYPKSWEARTTS